LDYIFYVTDVIATLITGKNATQMALLSFGCSMNVI